MKRITIDNLVEILKNYENKQIELFFKGTISMNIEFEVKKISNKENYLIFYDKFNKEISLNNHQIMKIEELEDKSILIKFDSFQTLEISF
ncbi:MAG: hypothetical protein HFJ60_00055 [Clostridia bacterium]|jgi:hypothetical protein|nr:hypothetical protein [Clostridia bacterium]